MAVRTLPEVSGRGSLDLPDQKPDQDALRETERRLLIATEAAGLGIHDYDVLSGTITRDARIREIWGVGPEEPVTYDTFMCGLHPDDRMETQAAVDRALDPNGEGRYYAEYRVISRKDNHERWIAATGQVFFDGGRPVRLIGTVQDVTDRKRTEEALDRSNRKIAEVLESIRDGFFFLDRDWRFTYINQRAAANLSLVAEDVLGQNLWERFPKIKGTAHEVHYRKAMETGQIQLFQITGVLTDRSYTINVYPSGEGISVCWQDMTETKAAEDALRESEERFRQLADASFEALVIHAEGLILDVNNRVTDMLGYDPADLIAKPFWEFIDTKYHDVVKENVRKGSSAIYEIELIHIDGRRVPVEVMGKPLSWRGQQVRVAALRDTTERKRAEETLSEKQILLNTIMQSTPDPVYVKDKESRIIMVNAALAKVVGKPLEEIIGKADSEYYGDLSVGQVLRQHDVRVMNSGQHELAEETVPTPSGYRTFLSSKTPYRNDSGEIIGVAGISQDITERKRAEEALKNAHDQLEMRVQERTEELQKSKELLEHLSSQLMSAQEEERKRIAAELHDSICANLAAIKMSLERKLAQMKEGASVLGIKVEDIIRTVQQCDQETRRIMNNLRPPMLDDLGLLPTLNWYCREFEKINPRIRIQKEIGISEEDVPDTIKIVIYRVMQEALNNAMKHSGADAVLISLQKESSQVQMLVQDNGQGFDTEKAVAEKRGMGLMNMMERVQLSGGSYSLRSEKGGGTSIVATWPILS